MSWWFPYYDPYKEWELFLLQMNVQTTVPDNIMSKIKLMCEDDNLVKFKSKSGKTITFKLKNIDPMIYLTNEQKLKLFEVTVGDNILLQDLLSSITFLCEEITIKDGGGHYYKHHVPRNVSCMGDRLMLEDGSFIHVKKSQTGLVNLSDLELLKD
jgi:hypothetical protein